MASGNTLRTFKLSNERHFEENLWGVIRLYLHSSCALHKSHLPNSGLTVYHGISGEQFHDSRAS